MSRNEQCCACFPLPSALCLPSPAPAPFCADSLRYRVEYALAHWEKEKILLRMNYKVLLVCAFMQYVHSVCTNIAYYLHVPREPLKDLGFLFFPALSKRMQILSEIMFFLFVGTALSFAFSPFFGPTARPLYSTVMLVRFFAVCALAQVLRCISFLVTILPGPNYHCRPGSPDYAPPQGAYDIFFRQDAFFGCGDLVFSSHTIFVLLCALSLTKYTDWSAARIRAVWFAVAVFGMMVVSARKHYSLDIVVAWYTVPLLWIAYDKYFPDRVPADFDLDRADETVRLIDV